MFEIENQSQEVADAFKCAFHLAADKRHEFITPEHLLVAIAGQPQFRLVADAEYVVAEIDKYFDNYVESVPEELDYDSPELSSQFLQVLNRAVTQIFNSESEKVEVPHLLYAIMNLDDSVAKDVLVALADSDTGYFMERIIEAYQGGVSTAPDSSDYSSDLPFDDFDMQSWRSFLTCLNDLVDSHNPLIGRERELERTIQVLCRKDKNNPLHVGEAGVGKTALAYGLAARIAAGDVPQRLQGCKVYELDLGSLMAGTQYRGDLERRLKDILGGVRDEGNAIVYIDEIHNIVGAGRVEGGSLDVSNLLKQYLERGDIRFMGATTYDEYNKSFLKNKALSRRFEKIDVDEPSTEECKLILRGLKGRYEEFHLVHYTDEAVDYAVEASDRFVTGKFLPDKAIDLIDEAGAWRQTHPLEHEAVQTVDKALVSEVLARVCNVDILAEDENDAARLEHLEENILARIYGQDKAVHQVSEAVLMGSAGLIDDNKPMASLLFVGPTGVGKTELAKVLANQLGVPLVRFDMSEYAEKHTVAKLIGSPAGYVGYDDGGLLTDAIRKTPHCVLLFDELEKAHSDIYNILLQVMDYAVLTDNKGQKVDFRHVVFIMTTNAGAQYARQDSLGFVKGRTAGEVMLKNVKQTFKPEFLNRLTAVTVFNDMDRPMASLILDKKLRDLSDKLAVRSVSLELSDSARAFLLDEGYSQEYGGREIERVVNSRLKPLLMREILFGSLKKGGTARVDTSDGALVISL